jgi:isopentenyl diphosphate isomerase/L-lactate dehydrogenase-like FMN-dependent dehydrogenase
MERRMAGLVQHLIRPFRRRLSSQHAGGEVGVLHAIAILSTEINRNMGLFGINTLAEIGPEFLLR